MSDPYAAPGSQLLTIADEDPRTGAALAAMARSEQAKMVWRYLEEYLAGRQARLDRELFVACDAGQPTAHLVAQKHEVFLFIQNLEKLIKSGTQASRILSPLMQQDEDASI